MSEKYSHFIKYIKKADQPLDAPFKSLLPYIYFSFSKKFSLLGNLRNWVQPAMPRLLSNLLDLLNEESAPSNGTTGSLERHQRMSKSKAYAWFLIGGITIHIPHCLLVEESCTFPWRWSICLTLICLTFSLNLSSNFFYIEIS